jgi:hypothetical protein
MALALAAAIAGCTLITGVGDLDPSLSAGDDPGDASTANDGAADVTGMTDGTASDVSQPDTSTRLKDITFENGAIVHPQTGGDGVTGDAGLSLLTRDASVNEAGDATVLTAIGGDFSLQASGSAFLEETFGAIDEVYVTARVRVDAVPSSAVTVLRIHPETGVNTIDIRLLQTLRLAVSLGAQIGQSSNPLTVGTVHRLGIFVRKGKNANGRLEVRLADDGAAFGTPFAQSTNIDFERPEKLQIGLPNPATAITFDDVKIDGAELPPL